MSNRSNRSKDALDSLKGDAPEASAPSTTGPFYIVYQGQIGPESTFQALGSNTSFMEGHEPLTTYPGLNIIEPDVWTAYKNHGATAERIASNQLDDVGVNLRGWSSTARLAELAALTEQAKAFEYMLELEQAKPMTGPRREQRSPELVAQLEKSLAGAQRVKPFEASGIMRQANARAAAAPQPAA